MSETVQLVLPNVQMPLALHTLSATGWALPSDLTVTQWQDCGKVLQRIDGARQWWIGDWWNAGVQWGDGQRACEELDLNYQTAANCAWVAGQFDFSLRREKLSWGHHKEVLGVDDTAVRQRFLLWCEEPLETEGKPRSIRALRQAIKEYLETKDWPEVDRERRRWVQELGYPTLANKTQDEQLLKWAKFAGVHVYIGRGSAWGNPFEVGKDGDRDYCIESFAQYYLPRKASLLETLATLKGKVLECFCFPQRCHGEVLIETLCREAWELLDGYMDRNTEHAEVIHAD